MIRRLALGTAQFGLNYGVANQHGQLGLEESKAVIDFARSANISTLDTAIAYGESEQRLGQIGVEGLHVISKLPSIPVPEKEISIWVADAVQGSLARLGVQQLYGLLLHRPLQLLEPEGPVLYKALCQLKDNGLVQKIGVSIYDPTELDALCPQYHFDLVQGPFNPIDRRLVHSGWLARLEDAGIEIHVRSIFLQGLLLMTPAKRPEKFSRWDAVWALWERWLSASGISPLQACIAYAMSHRAISKVVVGVDGIRQLKEIVAATGVELPTVPDEICSFDMDLISPQNWSKLT